MDNLTAMTRVAIFAAASAVQHEASQLMLADRDADAAAEYERAGRIYAEGDYPLAVEHCRKMAADLREVAALA